MSWFLVPDKLVLGISKMADPVGFSHLSSLHRSVQKTEPSGELQFCGHKYLVDEGGKRRIASMVLAERMAVVSQITSIYNCGEQKSNVNIAP